MADPLEITVAAHVALDKRETWEVRLPGLSKSVFRGPSLAELLDDAALHLMEVVPSWTAEQLDHLLLSPEVRLRKTVVERALRFGDSRKASEVKVRLTAFCTHWSKEGFWRVQIPRLGPETFAVRQLSGMPDRLGVYLEEWAKTGLRRKLVDAESLQGEYIELIDVEVELPSVLPSRPKKRAKKKRTADETSPDLPDRVWCPAGELRTVGVNLLQRARDGRLQAALGRDALVVDLVEQLQMDGSAILLVGESGVGKTAILEAVAAAFAAQGGTMQERTDVWRVDGARLIAGMSMVGQWEGRLSRLVDELYNRGDVLVVDDLPSLAWVGRSAQSETTMADYLLPHLQRGELRVVAECTPERLEAGRLKNPGFFANFRVVVVEPMSAAATYRVLLQHTRRMEAARNLVAEPELLETVQRVAERFGPRLVEPGRSVRVLQGFLGDVVSERTDRFQRARIGPSDLFAHFSASTGLPGFVLEPRLARSADAVSTFFAKHVLGQPTAVQAATDAVLCLQQGLDDPDRPVATLLFVGPTGVGKTETAKALAAYLFGDAKRLLRFDMSEVSGPGALHRLVGGAGRPDGDLTRAVANQPFSVVLLDEIEKAGSAVFDLLLQVLGEGRLTNAAGHTTDFRNTVIVMTSNLGVASARRRTGFARTSGSSDAAHYRSAAQAFFRPEFYNRIGAVVPFRSLGRADVEPLVTRMVGRVLSRRGLRRAGVVVALDDSLAEWLGEVGFDATYGARSLQRVVERELTVPLARRLIEAPVLQRGAFIQMWRTSEGLGMHLDALSDSATVDAGPRVQTWDEMAALHTHLVGLHGDAAEHVNWSILSAARTVLLDALAVAPLADADWDRLQTTTSVVETHAGLASELEDFEADWLARYRFEDGYVKDVRSDAWGLTTVKLVTQEVAVPVDRSRTRGAALQRLSSLEERMAALVFRVRNWGEPDPFVLRFQPLHDEAAGLAKELALGFAEAWGDWGRVQRWTRTEGWQEEEFVDGPCAVALSVPGLAQLLAPDLGLYLDAEDVGADRLLRLVDVSLHRGNPLTALAASDPLPVVERDRVALAPVCRRFGVLADEESPVTLADLAAGLRSVALRRVVH